MASTDQYGYNPVNLVDALVERAGATTTFAYDGDNRTPNTYPMGWPPEYRLLTTSPAIPKVSKYPTYDGRHTGRKKTVTTISLHLKKDEKERYGNVQRYDDGLMDHKPLIN